MKNLSITIVACCFVSLLFAQRIDRKALVERHSVKITAFDSLASLSVGNGRFAFTVDVTGLQSFPQAYANGVPLGTQSEWGWHSFPNTGDYKFEETLRNYRLNGRDVSYSVQWNQPERNKQASNYFRQNVHRLHLGNLGLEITKKDGTLATIDDVKNIEQELNMWTGIIHSQFTIEGVPVEVFTAADQSADAVTAKIKSPLLKEKRLSIRLRFPTPLGTWGDVGNVFNQDTSYISTQPTAGYGMSIMRKMDSTEYDVFLRFTGDTKVTAKSDHYFLFTPPAVDSFSLDCVFTDGKERESAIKAAVLSSTVPVAYEHISKRSAGNYKNFWNSGGAIDFAGSTDPRAHELERRIILSQYLTKIQCSGNEPPQETGLTYNSWFGKPHLEMHWWHGVHFALWGRPELLQSSMKWYTKVANEAFALAKRQGYQGLRWQKMTDPAGRESPSSVGAFLIWQQPHYIYFAELIYRHKKDPSVLREYADLVFATADFMASYAHYDSATNRYILGKGLIPAQERFKAEETFNPTYELVYWQWGLKTAIEWKKRLGQKPDPEWTKVLNGLSKLPVQEGLYLATESAKDSYTNPEFRTDHPSVLGALGMQPKSDLVDLKIMNNTFDWVIKNWTWPDTWGWDFPMTAMTAARLGRPEDAMNALMMNIKTNTYLKNGHNYQDDRLRLYLPGNGGLLAAIAIMCAGYDGSSDKPGIPLKGWKVKHEGLKKLF